MNYETILNEIQHAISKWLKIALIYARVSTNKQADEWESLEDQEKCCRLEAEKKWYHVIEVFSEPYTWAETNRPMWNELIKFCKRFNKFIDSVFIRDLDRFNRDWAESHIKLKNQLKKIWIKLKDVPWIIQWDKNSLEHHWIWYKWSDYSPSEWAELMKANSDKEERKKILTRTIWAEFSYTQKWFWTRSAPNWYKTEKIEVLVDWKAKKRTILIPDNESSLWLVAMFKMRAKWIYSDKEIVDEVNSLWYRSLVTKVRDKQTREVIWTKWWNKLTIKRLQEIISKPIYAWINRETWWKWDKRMTIIVKTHFDWLVDIGTWNKANRWKLRIVHNENWEYKILENVGDNQVKTKVRNKNNPDYPFKNVVLCDYCNKHFLWSASKWRSWDHFHAYHCSRWHKRYAFNKEEFEETVYKFLSTIKFNEDYIDLFEAVLKTKWNERTNQISSNNLVKGALVKDLEIKKKSYIEKITQLSSPLVISEFEKKIEDIENEIILMKEKNDSEIVTEDEFWEVLKYSKYFMEHFDKMALDKENPSVQEKVFKVLFRELPTYHNLVNGTPKMKLYIAINDDWNVDESEMAGLRRIELRSRVLETPILTFGPQA